jgi:predicted nuclease of predicted toxin-antitoxin system
VKFWLDAQLPPRLCGWLETESYVEATAVRELGLRDARDSDIFAAARSAEVIVMTKDADFPEMVMRQGPPPQILWVTSGNMTNSGLREFLSRSFPAALELLRKGEPLVRLLEAPPELRR